MYMGTMTVQFHMFWKLLAFFSFDNDDSNNNHILWILNTSMLKGSIFYLISHSPLVEMLFWLWSVI